MFEKYSYPLEYEWMRDMEWTDKKTDVKVQTLIYWDAVCYDADSKWISNLFKEIFTPILLA